mmetsp:Transcript_3914/g.6685  ORF Transcript_3914/g.6685 Transcript_3914/m.6685 type:complete len:89 (-) Transcript_3914:17-283(-)
MLYRLLSLKPITYGEHIPDPLGILDQRQIHKTKHASATKLQDARSKLGWRLGVFVINGINATSALPTIESDQLTDPLRHRLCLCRYNN